jgi:hypothetical protein
MRKSVSYLNTLRREFTDNRDELQACFDVADSEVFDVLNLDVHHLRQLSDQDVRAMVSAARNRLKETSKQLERWQVSSLKYQSFF